MNNINPIRLGWAFGLTFSLMYFGCVLMMAAVGREGTILAFNTMLHGIDVSSLIRMDMPAWEMAVGVVLTFLISWFIGATIANIYNFSGHWMSPKRVVS